MSSKKSAPAQNRDAARNLAATMRAEQAAREKRVKIITISAFGVAVAALVAAIIWAVIASRPAELPEPAPLATPSVAAESGGIPIGKDGVAGTSNEGAPVVDVYLDFRCSWCGVFEATNADVISEWRSAGDITYVLHPVAILDDGEKFSTRSAAAAVWVAEKSPEHFDKFVTEMFAVQPETGPQPLSDREMADIAKAVGAPAEVVNGIADLTSYKTYASWIAERTQAAGSDKKLESDLGQGRRGFSTPTIVIGGEKFGGDWRDQSQLRAAIDAAKQG